MHGVYAHSNLEWLGIGSIGFSVLKRTLSLIVKPSEPRAYFTSIIPFTSNVAINFGSTRQVNLIFLSLAERTRTRSRDKKV